MDPVSGHGRRWKLRRVRHSGRADGSVFQVDGVRGLLDLKLSFVPKVAEGIPVSLAAAAASDAVRKDTGMVSWLQWPDLVSIGGRALGRASVSFGPTGTFNARIAVNCFAPLESLRLDGIEPTSIRSALGVEIDIGMLRDKTVHAFDWYLAEWERGMHEKMVDRIRPTIPWLGSEVDVLTANGIVRGRAVGLEDGCALAVVSGNGRRTFTPQDVLLVRPAARQGRLS